MVVGNGRRGRGWVCGGLVVVALFLALAFAPVGVVRAATVRAPDCMGSSLATAISNAGAGDTITFAHDCPTATPITLTSTQMISKNVTLDGMGHTVVISGGNAVRLFTVGSGVTFTVNALTLTGGKSGSGKNGGAIDNNGTLTVTNSTLSGNSVNGGGGGAIANGGTLTVTNSTLSGNGCYGYGGAIANSGTGTVTNSTLNSNSTTNGYGGAIDNKGTLTVTNSTLNGNHAFIGGGGGIANGGTLTVTNSTLGGNFTTFGSGGAIDNNGTLTVTNSTLSNNSTTNGDGGGIANGGTLTVTNSTLSGNSASFRGGSRGSGGGIYNQSGGTLNAANTLIVNSILSDDVSGGINGTNTHNLTGSFTFATPLQNNGGPTVTLAIPTPATPTATDAYQGGDLATCNAIAPTGTPAGVYDQRGANRVVGGTCSIGAYEPGPVTTTTTLSAHPTRAAFGTPVIFTVAVRGVLGGMPPDGTNTVTVKNGTMALGTATLVSGTASFTTGSLLVGTDTITATYNGDTSYATSSGTTSVTVNAVTIILTAPTGNGSGNSGTALAPSIRAGGSITLSANPNTGVSYTSSNPNIAAVDPTTGQVTGISAGTVTIMASGPNGASGSMVVTVTGGTGGGLIDPAPGAHPVGMASTAAAGTTPVAAPPRRADGTASSSGSGVQPQVTGATVTPTPESQPARH